MTKEQIKAYEEQLIEDLNAKIESLPIEKNAECRKAYMFASEFKVKVLEILDNIGKAVEDD